jgi:hypothetical protein
MVETGTSYVFPVKKIIGIQNFLATRFVGIGLPFFLTTAHHISS